MTTEERLGDDIVRIETKLAYIEDFMNKLQNIAVEHTEAIDRLKNENKALRAKLGGAFGHGSGHSECPAPALLTPL